MLLLDSEPLLPSCGQKSANAMWKQAIGHVVKIPKQASARRHPLRKGFYKRRTGHLCEGTLIREGGGKDRDTSRAVRQAKRRRRKRGWGRERRRRRATPTWDPGCEDEGRRNVSAGGMLLTLLFYLRVKGTVESVRSELGTMQRRVIRGSSDSLEKVA